MATFNDLPDEILIHIFSQLIFQVIEGEDSKVLRDLYLTSGKTKSILDDSACWTSCIKNSKNKQCTYLIVFIKYCRLANIMDSQLSSDEKLKELKKEALDPVNTRLIAYSDKLRMFFALNSNEIPDSITDLAIRDEMFALFIIRDPLFMPKFLSKEKFIEQLALRYKSVALALVSRDNINVLLIGMITKIPMLRILDNSPASFIKQTDTRSTIHNILTSHESVFLQFLKNEHLKNTFLENYESQAVYEVISMAISMAKKHKVFIKNLKTKKPFEAIIADIVEQLTERQNNRVGLEV